MPRFLCYCPDYPDILDKRMEVRPQHLERVTKDKEDGIHVYGGLLRPRPGTKARDQQLPEGMLNIAGSFYVCVMPSLEDAWARVKDDVYWTANIWDKERVIVEELLD